MTDVWLEIAISASPSYVDELAGLIASEVPHAGAGLVIRESEVAFWVDVSAQVEAVAQLRALADALSSRGAALDATSIDVRATPPEKEWREAYKRYFKVARLSRQIVVVPSWESFEPAADDLVIHLDPGQAFGTGSHATTTLVLRELQLLADCGLKVTRALDAGTGSGILTIAISHLGLAGRLTAFDSDPLAVSATSENCENNGVAARIYLATSPSIEDGRHDLIVANIQRHILLDLAQALTERAAERATLVLSGLLTHELDEVAAAYERLGWKEIRREIDGDDTEWGVVTLVRAGS